MLLGRRASATTSTTWAADLDSRTMHRSPPRRAGHRHPAGHTSMRATSRRAPRRRARTRARPGGRAGRRTTAAWTPRASDERYTAIAATPPRVGRPVARITPRHAAHRDDRIEPPDRLPHTGSPPPARPAIPRVADARAAAARARTLAPVRRPPPRDRVQRRYPAAPSFPPTRTRHTPSRSARALPRRAPRRPPASSRPTPPSLHALFTPPFTPPSPRPSRRPPGATLASVPAPPAAARAQPPHHPLPPPPPPACPAPRAQPARPPPPPPPPPPPLPPSRARPRVRALSRARLRPLAAELMAHGRGHRIRAARHRRARAPVPDIYPPADGNARAYPRPSPAGEVALAPLFVPLPTGQGPRPHDRHASHTSVPETRTERGQGSRCR